ncbi:ABC transporter, ATP-binding/permease protein [Campylobacter sp. RM16187]|nr:ABC transporter, ATP-binding/permease protein [Campylobacter sp. RM16187]
MSSFFAVTPAQFFGFTISAISNGANNGLIYDLITKTTNLEPSSYNLAIAGIVLFFASSIVYILFRNFFCYIVVIIAQKIIINVRKKLFIKLTNIDFKEIIKMSKGDVIYTLMNDTQRLEYIFERPFYTIFSDIFDFIFVVGFLLYIEPAVLLILLITTPFIYIFSIKTARIQKQTSANTQKADSKITVSIEQLLGGYETIKSFNAEAKEQERFNKLSDESYKNRKAGTKSLSIFMPIEGTLSTIGIALVLLYAVYQVSNHALAVGMIVVIADYSRKFYQPIRNISNYLQVIQKALVSIGKIIEFLSIKEEVQTSLLKKEIKYKDVPVVVNNLKIYLDEVELVKEISFKCHKNELILIKGRSGSGKTSIIRAFVGLYKVSNGMIYINGIDINSYSNKELRAAISYCGQRTFLHDDTIINNILYPNSSRDLNGILAYLEKLNLKHLNIDETIGDDGNKLSGGEKSRMAFLRAVMKNSKILFLDEATSALDKDNENIVIDLLQELKQDGWAIIFCTHSNNEELINIADKVVCMD